MASTKVYDVAVKVGEYEHQGRKKNRYKNVGTVMDSGHGQFLILDRTFSPAGVPNPEGRDTVILSFFAPKDGQQGDDAGFDQPAAAPARQQAAPAPRPAAPAADFEDDIHFN